MGIRFRCHHCEHELNLKNFQAGRRARCPICSGRFRVPTTSCDFSAPLEDDEQELASTALRADQPGAGRSQASPSFDLKQPTGDLERFKRPAAEPTTGETVGKLPAPAKTPSSKKLGAKKLGAKRNSAKPASSAKAPAAQPAADSQGFAIQSPATQEAATQEAATQRAATQDAATQDASPLMPSSAGALLSGAVAEAPAAASPGVPRAVAEAPQAVWYVRPPSGGQFGPADSPTFYQWMQENRVAREALVWRDGWPQWMIAGNAFEEYYGPKWLPAETPQEATAATAPAASSAASAEAAEPASAVSGLSGANVASTSSETGLGSGPAVAAVDSTSPLGGPLGTSAATAGALADSGVTSPLTSPITSPVGGPAIVRPLGRRKRRRTNYTLGISVLAIVAIALVVILVTVLLSQ